MHPSRRNNHGFGDDDHLAFGYPHHYRRRMMDRMEEEDIMMEMEYYERHNNTLDNSLEELLKFIITSPQDRQEKEQQRKEVLNQFMIKKRRQAFELIEQFEKEFFTGSNLEVQLLDKLMCCVEFKVKYPQIFVGLKEKDAKKFLNSIKQVPDEPRKMITITELEAVIRAENQTLKQEMQQQLDKYFQLIQKQYDSEKQILEQLPDSHRAVATCLFLAEIQEDAQKYVKEPDVDKLFKDIFQEYLEKYFRIFITLSGSAKQHPADVRLQLLSLIADNQRNQKTQFQDVDQVLRRSQNTLEVLIRNFIKSYQNVKDLPLNKCEQVYTAKGYVTYKDLKFRSIFRSNEYHGFHTIDEQVLQVFETTTLLTERNRFFQIIDCKLQDKQGFIHIDQNYIIENTNETVQEQIQKVDVEDLLTSFENIAGQLQHLIDLSQLTVSQNGFEYKRIKIFVSDQPYANSIKRDIFQLLQTLNYDKIFCLLVEYLLVKGKLHNNCIDEEYISSALNHYRSLPQKPQMDQNVSLEEDLRYLLTCRQIKTIYGGEVRLEGSHVQVDSQLFYKSDTPSKVMHTLQICVYDLIIKTEFQVILKYLASKLQIEYNKLHIDQSYIKKLVQDLKRENQTSLTSVQQQHQGGSSHNRGQYQMNQSIKRSK